jgi:Hydrazine synthase alpha subunit middle domain
MSPGHLFAILTAALALLGASCSSGRDSQTGSSPFVDVDYTNQSAVVTAWNAEFDELGTLIGAQSSQGSARRNLLKEQALDPQALVQTTDKDGVDVILRRTAALLQYYRTKVLVPTIRIDDFEAKLSALADKAQSTTNGNARRDLFRQIAQVRRNAEFSNSLLGFDSIVAQLEQPGDGRIMEQSLARTSGHEKGGGPIIIKNFKSQPQIIKPLEGITVTSGPYQGEQLTGKFQGLELSYDGNELFFASTTSNDVFHLFNFNLSSKELAQLTDGADDDMDPVELPSGRIAFTSTRRGGIGRCILTPNSRTYTLFGAERDGTDIIPLSFHETNEFQPSVDNAGKLVYTRWDYLDRAWPTAHHLWLSYPDGRDPRNYHGNYPLPLDAMPEGTTVEQYGKVGFADGRILREDVTMSLRAVEGSTKYIAAATGHHEGFSGSLILVDTTIPDDHKMSQVKRIAPEYAFPEVEGGKHVWGTPWPLSEDFYLVNFNQSLVLLDRFGNREVIYEGTAPYRVRDPFPLRPRTKPPVLTVMTWQGKRASLPDHKRAVVSVINVYEGDMPLPQGMKAKWLRINQLIPSQTIRTCCSMLSIYYVGGINETTPRMSLGIVPVEADGSVYFEAPVGKALYFQLLDENGFAIQSMRSVTYVHPGENLQCMGCHEDKWKAVPNAEAALALQRAPSAIVPEVDSGAMPFNFYRLVKAPVFDKKCVPCHTEQGKGPDMTYRALVPHENWKWAFGYPGESEAENSGVWALTLLGVGGSRTTPGKFGAQASGLMQSINTKDYHKDVWSSLTADERKRITLWLDLNSPEIGWQSDNTGDMNAQRRGEPGWPPIEVDPENPTGVEKDFPLR